MRRCCHRALSASPASSMAALIPNLAYRSMVIFSPTAYKEKGEEWLATNVVGTGPFIFEEQVEGEFVQFRKNDDY